MNKTKLKTDFHRMLDPFSSVLSVYLFGSMVAGLDREGSDVDIAVHLDEGIPAETAGDIRFQLLELFEGYFGRSVDVVILNRASLKLIHQVLKHGVLLFARAPERTRAFSIRKRKEYFDFKYYIDKDIQAMRSFFGC